jgi:hypothetical protein
VRVQAYGFEDELDERGEERLDRALRAALATLGLKLAGDDSRAAADSER